MFRKILKFGLYTLLAYLCQATLARPMAVGGVAPNPALAMLAVVTVALGRKYAFFGSTLVGYLLEIMQPALDYISLVLYPVSTMLPALFLADRSERVNEERRTQGRRTTQLNPHLRTPLCAFFSTALYEFVHLLYIYLTGVPFDVPHAVRAFLSAVYTALIAAVIQFPVRRIFGLYRRNEEEEE